jgi:hypothetical protein
MKAILTAVQLATAISASRQNFGAKPDSELPATKLTPKETTMSPVMPKMVTVKESDTKAAKSVTPIV